MSLVLTGTPEEIKSPRALKVIATAIAAGVHLDRVEVKSQEDVIKATGPIAKSLALTFDKTAHIGTTISMMRTIASIAPATKLLGATDIEKAHGDAWLSFIWSSIDMPIESMILSPHEATKADLASSLQVIESHLASKSYMVGDAITCVDISLVVALKTALDNKLWEPKEGENLSRLYSDLITKSFFSAAVTALTQSGPVGAVPATGGSSGSGVLMNGPATPVFNRLYRRQRIRIKEVLKADGADYIGKTVTVAGWARTTRNANKGQLLFVELNDGSCGMSLQCVLDTGSTEGFDQCKASGGTGASFQFIGKVIASPAQGQAVEMQVVTGKLLGAVYGGNQEGTEVGGMLYPMSKKAHTLEFMRDVAHLRPRGRIHSAAMRIRHAMAYATHNFFHNHGFLYIHTPILTCADCEGAGEQFAVTTMLGTDHLALGVTVPVHEPPAPAAEGEKLSKKELKRRAKKEANKKVDPSKLEEVKVVGAVDYGKDFFARRANLTVSGQLNVETHACALSDVYTFGPTFRAENSHTARHLSEFWMIEPEIAFADLTDDINLAEDYLKYCVQFALDHCAEDLEFFENNPHGEEGLRDRLRNVLENPFKVRTYTGTSWYK